MTARHEITANDAGELRRRWTVDAVADLWQAIQHLFEQAQKAMARGGGVEIKLRPLSKCSVEQRKHLHALCADLSAQAEWHGHKLSPTGWKRLVIAGYREQEGHRQHTVPNFHNDGFIVIAEESSEDLTMKEYAACITLLYALGNERRVVWTNPKLQAQLAHYAALPDRRAA